MGENILEDEDATTSSSPDRSEISPSEVTKTKGKSGTCTVERLRNAHLHQGSGKYGDQIALLEAIDAKLKNKSTDEMSFGPSEACGTDTLKFTWEKDALWS